jgi:hypothetical protein
MILIYISRLIAMGAVLLSQSYLLVASDWHDYSRASSDSVRAETLRLAVSEKKSDRLLAAELLGQFPLYFSSDGHNGLGALDIFSAKKEGKICVWLSYNPTRS